MPSSKAKLRAKGLTKVPNEQASAVCSPAARTVNETSSHQDNNNSTKNIPFETLQEMKAEQYKLKEQLKQLQSELSDLTVEKENHILRLDSDIEEKKALLDECIELNGGSKKKKKKKKFPAPQDGEEALMPYEIEAVKKLGRLAGRLVKELVNLRKTKDDYVMEYMVELQQVKALDEILEIACRPVIDQRKGRLFLKTRGEELETQVACAGDKLTAVKRKYQENLEAGWEQAASKYGEEVKHLTNERARVQKEFLDKEAKLKEMQAKKLLLEKEISSKKARLERQTEANNKQIFSSSEFADLMNQRDILLTRIEKSINVIEDTKAAHDTVVLRMGELHAGLTKNRTRVDELQMKIGELKVKNENERAAMLSTSAVMEYVSQELNAKNGELLRLEADLEEIQNHKQMLEWNLNNSQSQKDGLEKENQGKLKRIEELKDEYFNNDE